MNTSCIRDFLIWSTLVVLGMPAEAFVLSAPGRASINCPSAPRPNRSCPLSSTPSTSPPGSARSPCAPVCSVVERGTSDTDEHKKAAFLEEIEKRQKVATRVADIYSREFGACFAVPGRVSENTDLNRLLTYLLWKVDALIDGFPQWKTFLDAKARIMPDVESLTAYASSDVRKFGPVMEFVDEPQQAYKELRNEVKSYFGSDAPEIMEVLDKSICLYIKHTEDLAIMDTPERHMKKYSLEDYSYLRLWTAGMFPSATIFWFGVDFPKDGRVEETCIAVSHMHDMYDYLKDREYSKQLSVWHYFDSPDDAVDYVKDYFYGVYDRVGPELQLFLDVSLTWQQDRSVQEGRGFDEDWYDKLDSIFNHMALRKEQQQQHEA